MRSAGAFHPKNGSLQQPHAPPNTCAEGILNVSGSVLCTSWYTEARRAPWHPFWEQSEVEIPSSVVCFLSTIELKGSDLRLARDNRLLPQFPHVKYLFGASWNSLTAASVRRRVCTMYFVVTVNNDLRYFSLW